MSEPTKPFLTQSPDLNGWLPSKVQDGGFRICDSEGRTVCLLESQDWQACPEIVAHIIKCVNEHAGLVTSLARYGQHRASCKIHGHHGQFCNCGWRAERAKLESALAQPARADLVTDVEFGSKETIDKLEAAIAENAEATT